MELCRPISSSRSIDRKFPPPLAMASQFVKKSSGCGGGDRCCPDQMVRGIRLQAVRSNGRFILQEIKAPSDDVVVVHTIREEGRLVLRMMRRKSAIATDQEIHPADEACATPAPEKSPLSRRSLAPLSTPPPPLPKPIVAAPPPPPPPPPAPIQCAAAPRVDSEPAAPVLASPIHPHSSTNSAMDSTCGEETMKKKLGQPEAHLLQELIGACGNRMDRIHVPYGIAVR